MHDELAVQPCDLLDAGLIDRRFATATHTQVATIATTCPQLAHAFAVAVARLVAQTFKLCGELGEHLLAMASLAGGFFRVITSDVTPSSLALADHHFLDLQVLRDPLVASRTVHDFGRHLASRLDGHADDVLAAAACQAR